MTAGTAVTLTAALTAGTPLVCALFRASRRINDAHDHPSGPVDAGAPPVTAARPGRATNLAASGRTVTGRETEQ